jgi:hypothetical protein
MEQLISDHARIMSDQRDLDSRQCQFDDDPDSDMMIDDPCVVDRVVRWSMSMNHDLRRFTIVDSNDSVVDPLAFDVLVRKRSTDTRLGLTICDWKVMDNARVSLVKFLGQFGM